MTTEFFMPMKKIPTTTHQQKKISTRGVKPVVYEPEQLKTARVKFMACLSKHVPAKKYTGAVRLVVKWCFPITGNHKDGEYKTTRPDTDNLIKLLKDCMTKLQFWTDDAIVASEINEKFYAVLPGVYIRIEELT